jgi:apolipoprotein N-acyltransferase
MHLVPFRQFVPFGVCFFVGPLVEAIGSGFEAGTEPTVFPLAGHSISVAICYRSSTRRSSGSSCFAAASC